MDDPPRPISEQTQQGADSTINALIETFTIVVQRIREQPYLFVIGVGILIVILVLGVYKMAPDIPTPLYVALGVLGILALAALGVGVIGIIMQARLSRISLEPQQQPSSDVSSVGELLSEQSSAGQKRLTWEDSRKEKESMRKFDRLRDWLDKLLDNEFQDMIRSLLTPAERTRLSAPTRGIDRGAFLGDMQVLGRLDEVEDYLCEKYPERFP